MVSRGFEGDLVDVPLLKCPNSSLVQEKYVEVTESREYMYICISYCDYVILLGKLSKFNTTNLYHW